MSVNFSKSPVWVVAVIVGLIVATALVAGYVDRPGGDTQVTAATETKCAACHQVTGLGLPPAFPALKGSPLTTGAIADHLKIVIEGKPGTAMQAWGSLNDLEIAAIVTYERNAWGNDTGDVVQPSDVKQAR